MANTRITCAAGSWTKVVDNAAADVSVMLAVPVPVFLQATATDSAPSGTEGPLELLQVGDGWSEATVAEKFPGVSGALYLWVRPKGEPPITDRPAIVGVSHA